MLLRALSASVLAVTLCSVAAAAPPRGAPAAQPRPAGRKPADRTPPTVRALKSSGERGTHIRLLYRVTDDSGRSSDRVVVYARTRVLTASRWGPFGPADGKLYYFDFPSSARMSGTYRFCVRSRDPSGNVGGPSCAPLVVRRQRGATLER